MGGQMSDARSIADERLAKGEITREEHAAILASLKPAPQPEKTDKTAWIMLASSAVIFLVVKMASTNIARYEGESAINWTLVYVIYAVCGLLFFIGLGGVLTKK